MNADVSRDSFQAARHHHRVVMEQGRVLVDADWNEQSAILLHRLKSLASDLFGPHWGSRSGEGLDPPTAGAPTMAIDPFAIGYQKKEDGKDEDLTIGTGRYYVHGIPCENESDKSSFFDQPDYPILGLKDYHLPDAASTPFLVYLHTWERHLTPYERSRPREHRFAGIDPLAQDPALRGLAPTSRTKLVWQVKVLVGSGTAQAALIDFGKTDFDDFKAVDDAFRKLLEAVSIVPDPKKPRGGLEVTTRRTASTPPSGPAPGCASAPESSYVRPENHLYRVEIHAGGPIGEATFKWSRENGSILFPIADLDPPGEMDWRVTLAHLGADDRLGLSVGDWVEPIDDRIALGVSPRSPLLLVTKIQPAERVVVLRRRKDDPAPSLDLRAGHPLLRRWDFAAPWPDEKAAAAKAPIHAGQPRRPNLAPDRALLIEGEPNASKSFEFSLEDGISVHFSRGQYRGGDYWLIPARHVTRDVIWPGKFDGGGAFQPEPVPPRDAGHAFAPLAYFKAGKLSAAEALRRLIDPKLLSFLVRR